MNTLGGHTWVEHLGVDACWALVDAATVGRVGVLVDGRPEIYPVNHAVHRRTVVFRTDVGTKLHGMGRMPWVSFEVDGFDEERAAGWSVLVKGRAEVVDPAAVDDLEGLELQVWGVGTGRHWIRIEPEEVTGRRIGHGLGDP